MKNHPLKRVVILTLSFLLLTGYAHAQTTISVLDNLINRVDSAFESADTTRFRQLIPLEDIWDFHAELVLKKMNRKAGAHRILKVYKDSAFVLISGLSSFGNSGDETNSALHYSGIYRLQKKDGEWRFTERIAFDRSNIIKAQHIRIIVKPGEGMDITDTLTVDNNDELGFAARLNHRAVVKEMLLNGRKTDYSFDGGLLWIASPVKLKQQIILSYSIKVEQDVKNVNSAYFGDGYGHVRNQYCWHPFFSYSSPRDRADFVVHVRLPQAYPLSTSLPQAERFQGDFRLIEARSESPTFALSLYYDKDWQVSYHQKGRINLVIYATPDFQPARDTLYRYFSETSDILNARFGAARSNYLGIVQDRSGGGNGWKNRSNNIIIAAAKGSYLILNKPPRAIFGHEVAHGWTLPIGEATNFLSEGWATYCEASILAARYVDTISKVFFASQRANYLNGGYEGRASLATDYSNSGVSYGKGAWLFYMLENQLGKEKFDAAMRRFILSDQQDVNHFMQFMSKAAGKDMKPFIQPWLKNKTIPLLGFRQESGRLIISQETDLFQFPLTIRWRLKDGAYTDQTALITGKEQSIDLPKTAWDGYTADPNQQVLLRQKEKH